MEMVNGYVFLDLTKSNVYAKALKVLESGKPVVVKDGSGAPYYVDSMNVDGTNVVITKGGKTITIANDNTITSVGDIQPHLYFYHFEFSYVNSAETTQYCLVEFYSTKNVEISVNGFKELLGTNKFKNINSSVNSLTDLELDSETLSIEIMLYNDLLMLATIEDTNSLVENTNFTDFDIQSANSYKTQLF